MINDSMKERSENQMKVFRKKQPSKIWDGGLKEKLEKVEKAGGEDAPVARSPGGGRVKMVVGKVKGVKEGQEAELQRRKKLTVESEGRFFWKASDELARKEITRQETNRKFRKVQLHGIEEGAYLVEQHHDEGGDVDKTSRESFLEPVISCINQIPDFKKLSFARVLVATGWFLLQHLPSTLTIGFLPASLWFLLLLL